MCKRHVLLSQALALYLLPTSTWCWGKAAEDSQLLTSQDFLVFEAFLRAEMGAKIGWFVQWVKSVLMAEMQGGGGLTNPPPLFEGVA